MADGYMDWLLEAPFPQLPPWVKRDPCAIVYVLGLLSHEPLHPLEVSVCANVSSFVRCDEITGRKNYSTYAWVLTYTCDLCDRLGHYLSR